MKKRTKLLLVLSVCFVVSVALYLSACVPDDGPAEGNMTLKRISVSRGDFSYRESGLKNGAPVIMVHGWPENSFCWDAVAGFLKQRLHVIAPDLRGLGDSERTLDVDKYQKAELAKDGQHWIEMLMAGEKFEMPGLYIYGKLDSVIIPDYLDGIEGFFSEGIEILELEASHFVQEQRPEEVAQAMNGFFLQAEN